MKNKFKLATVGLLFAAFSPFVSQPGTAQDPAKVAPKIVKVLLENYRVRVLEIRANPGEKLPMHSHPAHAVYTLTPIKGRNISRQGEITEFEAKRGTVGWSEPLTHITEYQGNTENHLILVELKELPKEKQR